MRVSFRMLPRVGLVVVALACGGKPAPEPPAPQPVAPQPSTQPTTDDADARARAEARAQAERDRMAREAAERAARARAAAMEAIASMINFEYDKADIRPDDEPTLNRKAAILQANPGLKLRISGHADERGSDEYNLALGNRRAAAAKRFLANKGIDGSRMDVISYGEERPLDPGHDDAAWAKNRRDEFEVTAGADNLVVPE